MNVEDAHGKISQYYCAENGTHAGLEFFKEAEYFYPNKVLANAYLSGQQIRWQYQ